MTPEIEPVLATSELRTMSRAEYMRLAELGFWGDEKIELLRGVVVRMSPINMPYSFAVTRLTSLLNVALQGRADITPQSTFPLGDDSAPEPDIAVVPYAEIWTEENRRMVLAVEVADSSLRKDRNVKAPLYAEAGIPEYWIVNIPDDLVEVYLEPVNGEYRRMTSYGRGSVLHPTAFPDVAIPVDAILLRKEPSK